MHLIEAFFSLAIVKILIIFSIIAISLKFKSPLSLSMFLGGILVVIFFGTDISKVPEIINEGVLKFDTLSLVVVIFLILTFSGILKVSGRLEKLTGDFEAAFGGGSSSFIIFPSVIGLLPMPGGAIFSAPMIEQRGIKEGMSPERLSAINYWFRHIWEVMWLLYPGIIISAEIFKISVTNVFYHHMPLTPIAMFIGWFFLLRGKVSGKGHINWTKLPVFILRLSPIIMLIASDVFLQFILPLLGIEIEKNIIMSMCLIGAITFVLITDKPNGKELFKEVFNKKMISMIVLVFMIFLFKSSLQISGAVNQISAEIQSYHLPFMIIICILPFIMGLLTGITIAFVSLSLTIIASLSALFPEISIYSVLILSYVSGVIGILLSPVHICIVVTKDYFGATLGGTLKKILLPLLFMLLTAIGFYFLYNLSIFK